MSLQEARDWVYAPFMATRLTLIAPLFASALLVTACGGGGTTATTGDPTTSSTTSASTGTTSAKNFADCSAIPAADMAPALGTGTATATVPPASHSCTYALDDPRLPSVTIEQFSASDFADGWDGAKAKVATTVLGPIDGTPQSETGIGDDAVIVSGPSSAQANPDAIGLVKIGDTIVRASVLDASGLTPAELTAVTAKVLRVVASHA